MTADPSLTYTYNTENQLTATAGMTYFYDGDGKRVAKSHHRPGGWAEMRRGCYLSGVVSE
jgi:hypothetical protein